MIWRLSHRFDPRACKLADRHYNRQKPGTPQFVPPGRCLVLLTPDADAFWVSSWPFAEFTHHAWAGAWMCTAFRNESPHLASELIRQAVAATRAYWGDPPPLGMISFVNAEKVRHKRDPGRCFRKAGFLPAHRPDCAIVVAAEVLADAAPCTCGSRTGGGLLAFQLRPDAMPPAEQAVGTQEAFAW